MIKKCPDCNGELEAGAMIDHTHGGILPQRYGKITLSTNKPTGIISNGQENTAFTDVRRVQAYRCQSCNRVFQYAQDVILTEDLHKQMNAITAIVLAIVGFMSAIILIVTMSAALLS